MQKFVLLVASNVTEDTAMEIAPMISRAAASKSFKRYLCELSDCKMS